jgi:hypothetical protein
MVVALIALVMAMTGSAVAAVNFAQNAGAVDGKSAVRASVTRSFAGGRLVATAADGPNKGRIPSKFLDLSPSVRGTASTFGQSFNVVDNQSLAPAQIGNVPGMGTVTASCVDQNPQAGVLNPSTTLTFANASGEAVNLMRRIASQDPVVQALPNGATHSFRILGSNTFELHLERRGTNFVVTGVVRQDNPGTAAAACLVYGYALTVPRQ